MLIIIMKEFRDIFHIHSGELFGYPCFGNRYHPGGFFLATEAA